MANKAGYVYEHRLVLARRLNRALLKQERVHHIDGDKSNNNHENLQLISTADHAIQNHLCSNCHLRKEVRRLKAELKALKKDAQPTLS